MGRAYSIDLRERVVARVAVGETVRSVAATFDVSVASVVKWSQRLRRTGSVKPDKMGGYRPKILRGPHRDWLLARIEGEQPFTLRGLVAELAERGLKVDDRQVWTFVHEEGLSFKKSVLPAEQERVDVARRRARWKASLTRPGPRPTWRRCAAGLREDDVSRRASRMRIGRR